MKSELLSSLLRSLAFLLLIRVHVVLRQRDASRLISLDWARSSSYTDSIHLKGTRSGRISLLHLLLQVLFLMS